MNSDLAIYESGNGGELNLISSDLETTSSIWNQIYLGLFGGNIGNIHEDIEVKAPTEENVDYWQNALLNNNLTSRTETFIDRIAITSQGLFDLENIIKSDLSFLSELGTLEISVVAIDLDKIEIKIIINEIDTFQFIWDATRKEIIQESFVGFNPFIPPVVPIQDGFDYEFDFELD